MRRSFRIRCSLIAAAVLVLGGCAIDTKQQPQAMAASHLDAVQKLHLARAGGEFQRVMDRWLK